MYVMLILLIIDLRFPLDGSVRLHFSNSPESRLMGVNETHTRYTVESSAGNSTKKIHNTKKHFCPPNDVTKWSQNGHINSNNGKKEMSSFH